MIVLVGKLVGKLEGKLEVTVRLQQLPLLPGMQKADENILTVFAVFSIFNSSPPSIAIITWALRHAGYATL